jgi:hypothetical protein
MKTTIKTLIALLVVTNAFAIDRIVQENGPTGTFPTISAAVTAAVDGDRIIIYPKIGDNPYVENITINKSLEFASAEDGVRYKIQGDISLVALNNRTITIIGAHITNGNIVGASAGWRTNVNIMGCLVDGGDITFNNQYFASIVSNILQNGGITIAHGKVIGNELSNENKIITIANSTSISNDSINIIANKTSRIFCSSDVLLNIYNNLIVRNIATDNFYAIQYSFASSTTNKLNIFNNTIVTTTSSTGSTLNYFLISSSPALIKNNIFQKVGSGVSPKFSFSPNINITASYNYYFTSTTIASESNPVNLTAAPVNATTGQLILPTLALNGADPSFEFYDLDLSIGDAGCLGGSYTLDNYFPITGSSRVYNIDMPFGITTSGGSLNIKADGFDR